MSAVSRLGRTIVGTALCLALTGVVADVAAARHKQPKWKYHQLDRDRCKDAASMDADRNRYAEQIWFDLDGDCRFDTRLYNTLGHDSFAEETSYDMDENGRAEYVIQDTDQRVGFELLYVDAYQDGLYEAAYPLASVPVAATNQNAVLERRNREAVTATIVSMTPGYPSFVDAVAGSYSCAFCT